MRTDRKGKKSKYLVVKLTFKSQRDKAEAEKKTKKQSDVKDKKPDEHGTLQD